MRGDPACGRAGRATCEHPGVVSETAPREPDACPNCGAHVEGLLSGAEEADAPGGEPADPSTQKRRCPDCGTWLVRRIGEPWRLL